MTKRRQSASRRAGQAAAERLAIAALGFIAGEPERLGRFLAMTGIGPDSIRAAARDPQFLLGVLDHLAADEPLLLAFAAENAIDPGEVIKARVSWPGVVGSATRRDRIMRTAASDGAMCERTMPGFCRDCRRDVPERAARCSGCGSPRLLRHPEIDALAIAHVDCDAFYATIEKRDDPSLADKPVTVGGRQRGVVLTACYVARTFGVRSAMPMFEARRLCPHASVVRPDMEKYARVGRQVRELMFKLTPLVEPVSIDEAFMDLSGTARLHGMSPAKSLADFAA